MWKMTQRSWAAGRLDAELMGRQDLAKYFQGASELVNFRVRKQGLVSKRRGTDLAASLSGLLGHLAQDDDAQETSTPVAVGMVRILPLLHERDAGYYILMTCGRAFLCSRDGVRLMDGTWARRIADYELTDYADAEPTDGDKRPYYIAVPYVDTDLSGIDHCQSGDTVFLAHPSYRPARMVFNGRTLAYSVITFDHGEWRRPAILSAVKKGVDSGVTGAGSKTVQYMCTYVKDGMESQPSEPFSVSYVSPWKSGGIVTVTCDKGDNESEPDYYNVYKKTDTQFGLIATVGSPQSLSLSPSVAAMGDGASLSFRAGAYYRRYYYSKGWKGIWTSAASPSMADILNTVPDSVDTGGAAIVFDAYNTDGQAYALPFIGGAVSPGGARFSFGTHPNTAITRVQVALDNFQCVADGSSLSNCMQIRRHYAGVRFRVKVEARLSYGEGQDAPALKTYTSDMLSMPSPYEDDTETGSADAWKGAYRTRDESAGLRIWYNASAAKDPRADQDGYVGKYHEINVFGDKTPLRLIDVDFAAWISAQFGADAQRCQVEAITVEGFESDGTTPVDLLFCGVRFISTIGAAKTIEDEYVTPDLSVTPPVSGNHFSRPGEYPACVGMYGQRLVYAASSSQPFTFWMSRVGDLYDFTPHDSIREDDAIEATLASTEFPRIRHIVVGRDLMLLTEACEWKVAPVSGNALTYKTLSADIQSAIGCEGAVKPVAVGDEIVFLKRGGEALLATRYAFQSDGYESRDLSVLSQWLFRANPVVRMVYRQNPDSTVWCVLADGTIAALVYMKEHEVVAWSRHVLGGGWKAVDAVTSQAESNGSTEVMLLVERGGEYALWRMRDEIPVRSGRLPAEDFLCADCVHALAEGEAVPEGMRTVVAADGRTLAYVPFSAELETVRPEPQGAAGTIQFEVRNAKAAEVRVIDSGSFTVRAVGVPEGLAVASGTAAAVAGGEVSLFSGDVRKVLAGRNGTDGRVVVRSEDEWPLNLLSLSVDYEIEPLSGSKG